MTTPTIGQQSVPKAAEPSWQHKIVNHWVGLLPDPPRRRGSLSALAAMRDALTGQPGIAAMRHISPHIPHHKPIKVTLDALLVGAIFGRHRMHVPQRTIAAALGSIDNPGMQRRISALLQASRPELPDLLRHLADLLSSHHQGFDYVSLLYDVGWWDSYHILSTGIPAAEAIRLRWATDYTRNSST